MKLFVLGNGFDRGHGLPTNYWDFRTFIEHVDDEFLRSFESRYDLYPSTTEARQLLLWNEFEKNLANIDEDSIIDQGNGIDMGLEDDSEIGIYDTLYIHHSEELGDIKKLEKLLKRWVRGIRIRDLRPMTSLISSTDDAFYVTFNYTSVLETVYHIPSDRIIHVHGSLRMDDDDPILGHGSKERLQKIRADIEEAESIFDEKWESICRAVEDYYVQTFKDVSRYQYKLNRLWMKNIDEVLVIGFSMAEVDLPYIEMINHLISPTAQWKVYYHNPNEINYKKKTLDKCGVQTAHIQMLSTSDFFDVR